MTSNYGHEKWRGGEKKMRACRVLVLLGILFHAEISFHLKCSF